MLWGQYSLGRKPDLHWFRLFRVLLLSYLVEALVVPRRNNPGFDLGGYARSHREC